LSFSGFAYVVIGVIFLVHDSAAIYKCTESHLWIYIIVNVLLSAYLTIRQLHKQKFKTYTYDDDDNDNDNDNDCTYICEQIVYLLVYIGMGIWGYIELYVIPNNIDFNNITISDTNISTNISANMNTTLGSVYNNTYAILNYNHNHNHNHINSRCSELMNTYIWYFGLVTVILQFIAVGIICFICLIVCTFGCFTCYISK